MEDVFYEISCQVWKCSLFPSPSVSGPYNCWKLQQRISMISHTQTSNLTDLVSSKRSDYQIEMCVQPFYHLICGCVYVQWGEEWLHQSPLALRYCGNMAQYCCWWWSEIVVHLHFEDFLLLSLLLCWRVVLPHIIVESAGIAVLELNWLGFSPMTIEHMSKKKAELAL